MAEDTTPEAVDAEELAERLAEEKMREAHLGKPMAEFERVRRTKVFDGEEVDVAYRLQPVSLGFITDYYAPLTPGVVEHVDGIRIDRDISIPLKDGRTLYADLFRPEGQLELLPVIAVWTPFGKRHWLGADVTPALHQAMGVPKGTISDMPAFEAPDPSYWCRVGYAICNIDATGSGYSEGDQAFCTTQGGRDGAEAIDWIGEQPWSNGRVGLVGNSGLAMGQWFIAAEQPKHLACIAPWEGSADLYRESICHGGIPAPAFADMIFANFRGPGLTEDPATMIHERPLFDAYWADKAAVFERIKVPAYVCGGFSHFHLRGSMEGFRRMKSRRKWLRLHREFEWPDFNEPANREDLKLFFDRYLRDMHNGWEMTPKVRVDVMDAYDHDFRVRRAEADFPIPRVEYTKFYLDAAGTMSLTPAETETTAGYDSVTGQLNFDFRCDDDLELTGNFVLRLWISAETDDADVFVTVTKMAQDGQTWIPTLALGAPDPGAQGRLRASMRELDPAKSLPYLPQYTFTNPQKLTPGEPVALDIEIWPHGRIWHKGEILRVTVAGRAIRDESWFLPVVVDSINSGRHTVHTGGRFDSYLLAPVVPPKWVSGDYVVR